MTDQPPVAYEQPQPDDQDTGNDQLGELSFWGRWGELFLATSVIALGVVVLIETQDIRVTRAVARVSPRVIPQIVGSGLIIVGLWYAIDVFKAPHVGGGGEDSEDVDPDAKTDWNAILMIAVALVCYAALIDTAGFIIASAVLFTVSAFAMGSRSVVRDAIIAMILSVVVFFVFDTWLGVRLSEGWLATILP